MGDGGRNRRESLPQSRSSQNKATKKWRVSDLNHAVTQSVVIELWVASTCRYDHHHNTHRIASRRMARSARCAAHGTQRMARKTNTKRLNHQAMLHNNHITSFTGRYDEDLQHRHTSLPSFKPLFAYPCPSSSFELPMFIHMHDHSSF